MNKFADKKSWEEEGVQKRNFRSIFIELYFYRMKVKSTTNYSSFCHWYTFAGDMPFSESNRDNVCEYLNRRNFRADKFMRIFGQRLCLREIAQKLVPNF